MCFCWDSEQYSSQTSKTIVKHKKYVLCSYTLFEAVPTSMLQKLICLPRGNRNTTHDVAKSERYPIQETEAEQSM